MKLLLLSLLVVAATGSFFDNFMARFRNQNSTDELTEQTGNRTRNIERGLRRGFGVDPAQRRDRLERLRGRAQRRMGRMNSTLMAELRRNRERVPNVTIDHSPKILEDDLFKLNEMEGVSDYLYQGDINLNDAQLNEIESENADGEVRAKRQVSTTTQKWTNKVVYYEIDASINDRKRASIAAALKYIQDNTCVRFQLSTTAANRVRVFSGSGCYSYIGMIGGVQDLSLGNGCEVIGTVAHEFAHALGVWHTQMRYDRDTYVTLDLSSVPTAYQGNFDKRTSANTINYTPYEYGSFMHYSANSFSSDATKLSLVPKNADYAYTMGNRQISFYDMQMIRTAYQCTACTNTIVCKNGGVQNPAKCTACTCPLGYGGNDCSVRPTGCGATLAATTAYQTTTIQVGNTTDSANVRDDFTLCNHWITAPAGKKIQVKITSMYNPQCNYGCVFNGVEIKNLADQKMVNPRICCPAFNNKEITSTLNPTPIIAYNRYYYTTFTVQYRYI